MTAPVGPDPGRLAALAAWDVAMLGGAVAAVRAVAERGRPWRARLEAVRRALETGEGWSGPTARSCAAALEELSVVAWAVEAAVAGSLAALERMSAEAARAQELADAALAVAATLSTGELSFRRNPLIDVLPSWLPADDPVGSAGAYDLARAALEHAAAARVAAEEAAAALAGLGVGDASVPPDFAGLAGRIPVAQPACVTSVPAGGSPAAVATWWGGLPAPTQLAALRRLPQVLGGLDGVPAWARDRANRVLLADALRDPGTPAAAADTARTVATRIALAEGAGESVQLHLLDLAGDRVVLALGDLDTADAVGVLVPGIGNTPEDDLDALLGDAKAVREAASTAAPGLSVATAVWLGYRTPRTPWAVITRVSAWRGGPALAGALAGLRAARSALAEPAGRTTVVAHSYGTVVVDEAADEPGVLAADAVVLFGSPGMEGTAEGLEAPEVYDAAALGDPVAVLRWFGADTRQPGYGSTGLPVDPFAGHSDYYDPGRPTLPATGAVVAGTGVPG